MFDWIKLDNVVSVWWLFLVSSSLITLLFWFWTKNYKFKNVSFSSILKLDTQSLIWLSFLYVIVCAFRSTLPRADVQRIVLWDTWFSSVFVGRTVATIAETAFILQWSIVLRKIGESLNNQLIKRISLIIVFLIAIAEIFSWFAVITTNYLGNVVEESLWGISYTIILLSLIIMNKKLTGSLKLANFFAQLGCLLYITFMFTVDVPMYFNRLMNDISTGKTYLSFVDGIIDLNTRWILTHQISDWKTEIPWQTLYFTLAVLVSISLCYLPLDKERLIKYLKK